MKPVLTTLTMDGSFLSIATASGMPDHARSIQVGNRGSNAWYVSFDGGSTYRTLASNEFWEWPQDRGVWRSLELTISLKGTAADVLEIEAWT